MGNTDPNKTKTGNKYEVKPQYEELSKQIPNKDTPSNDPSLLPLKLPRQLPFKIPRSLNLPKIPNVLAQTNERKLTQRIETHAAADQQTTGPAGNDQQAPSLPLRNKKSAEANQIRVRKKTFQNDTVPTYQNDAVANTSRQQLFTSKQTICWSRKITQNDDALTNSNDIVSKTSAQLSPAGSPAGTHFSQQSLAAGSNCNLLNAVFQPSETTSLHVYDQFPKPAAGHSKYTHLLIQNQQLH
ncbi:hypothetical protein F511_11856 [Dorcoceras hygrometricum]|uniref:Uncharacterized protein n=1 Tax=Dorcoceras hygrometricum TaxID=472368 RepID=A0A2Z7AB39_9LAMI|nr:hypothetical protein F511_11856 [Dorcoceras hygrometricum]